MGSSQPPPPPLLLLALLLLLLQASDRNSSVLASSSTDTTTAETESLPSVSLTSPFSYSSSTVGETQTSLENPGPGSTAHPNSPSSEPTTSPSPSDSGAASTTQPTSSQPEPDTHPSPGSPSSEHTVASPSSALSSISLATLPWSSTHPNPSMLPSSVSMATTDQTSETSGYAPGDAGAPKLHRNPGVVVAVCLLVSVLLIGCVIAAVRRCHSGVSEFQKLDEGLVSRRSSSAHRTLP
ncbi:cell wall protein RBR3-like [Cervus elaphus]|uniref:cell wall protein RBR3-like n=1 Tax=Cervus elaphus TaxID=9860 RepID=UPI001CC27AAD|nr:cell wall protein RBR3-like [Cervus elaphus]